MTLKNIISKISGILFILSIIDICFANNLSLEHIDNELVLSLRSKYIPDYIFKMKIDYEDNELDPEIKFNTKRNLVKQFQNQINDINENDINFDGTNNIFNNNINININKDPFQTSSDKTYKEDRIESNCTTVTLSSQHPNVIITSCIEFEAGTYWYNSFETSKQYWPLDKLNIKKRPLLSNEYDNQGIAEPYYLNSKGLFIYYEANATLFHSVNEIKNTFCLYSEQKAPYHREHQITSLKYTFCHYNNSKVTHLNAVKLFLGKPKNIPDEKMIYDPIWSTWAKYKVNINEKNIIEYAKSIKDHGFSNSQFEIDDDWEICYGSAEVNTKKFKNMKNTISELKALGFRTTMWVHPFVNKNCEPYYSRYKDLGYLISNFNGSYDTSWWNSKDLEAGHFDFTNPLVAEWYQNRLENLKAEIGVDSFKFDAGESSFAPQIPQLNCVQGEQPNCLSRAYVNTVSELGPMIEIRVGAQTQYLPNYVRMLDRNSNWSFDVGLPTLITTLLMMNIAGYPFVMPDMIGGNVYANDKISEELFIRWVQANTFMPILQFSIPPWDISEKATNLTKKFVNLHRQYGDKIIEAMKQSVKDGTPVNPPIWWIDPTDPIALACDDEYLLGEDILVAPILKEGYTFRDIYLPVGKWRDEASVDHTIIEGPKFLNNYQADLETLPYFTKINEN